MLIRYKGFVYLTVHACTATGLMDDGTAFRQSMRIDEHTAENTAVNSNYLFSSFNIAM